MADIHTLAEAFNCVFAADTSADPEKWSEDNPTYGHCAVAALVVQDYFGGDILRVQAVGPGFDWGYYFNRLPGGVVVDLTHLQFPLGTSFSNLDFRTRRKLLDPTDPRNEGTIRRYMTFKYRVADALDKLL